jgi:hypothetical protein
MFHERSVLSLMSVATAAMPKKQLLDPFIKTAAIRLLSPPL